MVKIFCPKCNTKYKIQESHVGKLANCKKCGEKFVVETSHDLPLFLQVAILNKLISKEQIDEVYKIQNNEKKSGKNRPIENIIIEKEIILTIDFNYFFVQ